VRWFNLELPKTSEHKARKSRAVFAALSIWFYLKSTIWLRHRMAKLWGFLPRNAL